MRIINNNNKQLILTCLTAAANLKWLSCFHDQPAAVHNEKIDLLLFLVRTLVIRLQTFLTYFL